MLPYINIRELHHLPNRLELQSANGRTAFQYASSATGASVDERENFAVTCLITVQLADLLK